MSMFYMPVKVYEEKDVVINHAADLAKFGKKALIVTKDVEPMVVRAANNIEGVQTTFVGSLNVVDILNCDKFIISQDAVKLVEEVYAE